MLRTKKKAEKNISPYSANWRRFRSNKMSMTFATIILLAILIALSGYLISPDKTSFANSQHPELSVLPPGTKISFLKIPSEKPIEKQSFFDFLINGKKPGEQEIPISDFTIGKNRVRIAEFTPFDEEPIYKEYPLEIFQKDGLSSINKEHFEEEFIVSKRYLFGTDKFGRDLLSRMIIGARVSVFVGFISVIISLIVGIFLGSLAGYFKGKVDDLISWLINVVWSLPTILLVIAITFALGKGFWQVFVAVGLTMWVDVARITRGEFIAYREKEFVDAARIMGFRPGRIILRHILPNVSGSLIVISAANFAAAILIESGLSFLGLGVQPPRPSWGSMIRDHYNYLMLDAAYLAIIPGLAIMILVLSFMMVGKGMRDSFDVREN